MSNFTPKRKTSEELELEKIKVHRSKVSTQVKLNQINLKRALNKKNPYRLNDLSKIERKAMPSSKGAQVPSSQPQVQQEPQVFVSSREALVETVVTEPHKPRQVDAKRHTAAVNTNRTVIVPETSKKTKEAESIVKTVHNNSILEKTLENYNEVPIPAVSGTKRFTVLEPSLLQKTLENYKDLPVPGLSSVKEIRKTNDKIDYYCELCDSLCPPNTIVQHLLGLRHALQYLKTYHTNIYERYKSKPKREIGEEVKEFLLNNEKITGRGMIKVEQESVSQPFFDTRHSQVQSQGPQHENMSYDSIKKNPGSSKDQQDEYLEETLNSFRCRLCDIICYTKMVWIDHIQGKKHLKNQSRKPGESVIKPKSFRINAEAHLNKILKTIEEPVVGLEFLKETQYRQLDKYFCLICNAPVGESKIIAHLLGIKHQIKYLKHCNKNKKANKIEEILMLPTNLKENLLKKECRDLNKRYGKGKIIVYKSERL